MNTPIITWSCVAGIFVLFLIVRLCHACIFCAKGIHRFIEFGSEREEFFIPGDIDPEKSTDYDFEDFDEL